MCSLDLEPVKAMLSPNIFETLGIKPVVLVKIDTLTGGEEEEEAKNLQ